MNLKRPGALGYALIICLWPPKVAAAIVNGTIDDVRGDSVTGSQVIYYPEDVWNDQTCGNKCSITPNASRAFDGTYTAGTYSPAPAGSGGLASSPQAGGSAEPILPRAISTVLIGISMEFTGRIHKIFLF